MQGQINMHSNRRRRRQRELITRHMPRSIFTGASNIFYTHSQRMIDHQYHIFIRRRRGAVASSSLCQTDKKPIIQKIGAFYTHTYAISILYLVENDMRRIKMKMYPL